MIKTNNLKVTIHNTATVGLVQHTLQAIWGLGLMERWFCIWQFRDNPKIIALFSPTIAY